MNPELEKIVAAGRLPSHLAGKVEALAPGTCCSHRSWGVGRVAEWDLIGDRMLIDFPEKPGHAMKLEFAAKSLTPLPPEHILARRFTELSVLQTMSEDSPEELVKAVLESHGGSILLDDFDDVVKGSIVSEGKFKSWWEATKRKLRADRRFVVPSKRNDPLLLRDEAVSVTDAMIADFTEARDLKSKVRAAEVILKDMGAFESPETELIPLIDDLYEALSRSFRLNPVQAIDLILVRERLFAESSKLRESWVEGKKSVEGGEEEEAGDGQEGGIRVIELTEVIRHHRGKLDELISGLSVSSVRSLFHALPEAFAGEDWVAEVLKHLNRLGPRGVTELARFMNTSEQRGEFSTSLSNSIRHRTVSADVLVWICKERTGAAENLFNSDLATCIIQVLERDYYDDEASRSNRLHDLLLNEKELLPDLMRTCDLSHAKHFTRRLMASPVFEELNRRSLLARIVKVHAKTGDLVSGDDKQEDSRLIVSWDSLEEKKKTYDKLVQSEIPANTKEIQIAREYGDLRENFEFKAAKQKQAVLMRLKSEAERDLGNARATDFIGVDTSVVSIGTRVELEETEGGRQLAYSILGAWDSDPDKNIISYLTGIGEALLGARVGETVQLPSGEETTRDVRILSIEAVFTDPDDNADDENPDADADADGNATGD